MRQSHIRLVKLSGLPMLARDKNRGLGSAAFCVLLFAAGDPRDALVIWTAKMSSFDVACSIDIQLLCGAGLERTKAFLRTCPEADAKEALDYIESCIPTGDFEDFTPTHWLERCLHYYGLAPASLIGRERPER